MTQIDNGGPVMPVVLEKAAQDGGYIRIPWPGMSLRDWFAGQALIGLVAGRVVGDLTIEGEAVDAYRYADAMLAARKEQTT